MDFNYTLKYRTFDELLDDVQLEFQNYNLEEMIEPQTLIKTARKINYDLGLRIQQTAESVLEVSHRRAKLPDNFYSFNYALVCLDRTVHTGYDMGGTHIEEIPYNETPPTLTPCTDPVVNGSGCDCTVPEGYDPLLPYGQTCNSPRVFVNCKNEKFELIQIIGPSQTVKFKSLLPLKMRPNPNVDCDCPNLFYTCENEAWIKDGYLNTNFESGHVYINYQSSMEDDQGNLLVPDHELLNEYYEYALKKKILETLAMNDENVGQKLSYIAQELRGARNNALSLVNTPNFEELRMVWTTNRKAMYGRYYDMFKSYPLRADRILGNRILR